MALLMKLRSTVSSRCRSVRTQRATRQQAQIDAHRARHRLEFGTDALDQRCDREIRQVRLDVARVQPRHIEQRAEQIVQRDQRQPCALQQRRGRLFRQRLLVHGLQKQQRRIERLAQVVARRGEEARLALVGQIRLLLGLLERELDLATRLELAGQAHVERFVLLGALTHRLFELRGRLEP